MKTACVCAGEDWVRADEGCVHAKLETISLTQVESSDHDTNLSTRSCDKDILHITVDQNGQTDNRYPTASKTTNSY